MILVEQLVKRFGNFTAVDGVSLRVEPGQIHGFLGPNGAGKTTSIRMIAGLLKPDAGRIVVNGHDLSTAPEAAKAALITRRCFMPCEKLSTSSSSQRPSSNTSSISRTRSPTAPSSIP